MRVARFPAAAEDVGDSTIQMTMRYSQRVPKVIQAAVDGLDLFHASEVGTGTEIGTRAEFSTTG